MIETQSVAPPQTQAQHETEAARWAASPRPGMLTIEQARAELARYAYKPSWTFRLVPGRGYGGLYGDLTLIIEFDAPDATGASSTPVRLHSVSPIPYELTAVLLGAVLRHAVAAAEHHETDEWFRRGGVLVTDPHPRGDRP